MTTVSATSLGATSKVTKQWEGSLFPDQRSNGLPGKCSCMCTVCSDSFCDPAPSFPGSSSVTEQLFMARAALPRDLLTPVIEPHIPGFCFIDDLYCLSHQGSPLPEHGVIFPWDCSCIKSGHMKESRPESGEIQRRAEMQSEPLVLR